MKHLTEEELMAYREGGHKDHRQIAVHLSECPLCYEAMARIENVFTALSAMPEPEPGPDFEERMWGQLAPRLLVNSTKWWEGLFSPRRFVAVAASGGGRRAGVLRRKNDQAQRTQHGHCGYQQSSGTGARCCRGEHLDRSEMVLMELQNTQPVDDTKHLIDFSSAQHRAEDLLEENRLYRETALKEGRSGDGQHAR